MAKKATKKKTVTKKVTKKKTSTKRSSSLDKLLYADLQKLLKAEQKESLKKASREKLDLPLNKPKRRKVLIPSTGETFFATDTKISAKTSYIENPLEMADEIFAFKAKLKKEVKKRVKKGEGLAVGYEFTFKFDKDVYPENLVPQRGFTNRFFIGSDLDGSLDDVLNDITKQFVDVYLTRKHCLGVKLENLIIQKTKAPKVIKEEGIDFFKLERRAKKKASKKTQRKNNRRK